MIEGEFKTYGINRGIKYFNKLSEKEKLDITGTK